MNAPDNEREHLEGQRADSARNGHGRENGHDDSNGNGKATSTLDAYLDGRLGGAERLAFETRIARDPALAGDVELHRRMERSLRGLFVVPPFTGLPTNGHPAPATRGEPGRPIAASRVAAAAGAGMVLSVATNSVRRWTRGHFLMSGLLGAIVVTAGLLTYNLWAERRVSFDDVYRQTVASASEKSGEGQAFESACGDSFGRILRPIKPPPAGVKVVGVSQAPVVSRKTVVLHTRIDGQDVLLFADQPGEVTADLYRRRGTNCHLHLFERQAGGLVLYELTPYDQPRLLDQYADPPPPTECETGEQ